jgi:nitrate reductase gamma subunit
VRHIGYLQEFRRDNALQTVTQSLQPVQGLALFWTRRIIIITTTTTTTTNNNNNNIRLSLMAVSGTNALLKVTRGSEIEYR